MGLWAGTLKPNNETIGWSIIYSFDIRADSTILTQSLGADGNTYYSEGTWDYVRNDILCNNNFNYFLGSFPKPERNLISTGVVENLSGTYNKNDSIITGHGQLWISSLSDGFLRKAYRHIYQLSMEHPI